MLFRSQGLEKPSIVDDLLDLGKYPQKPNYEMADDQPLVLWDCVFNGDNESNSNKDVHWVYPEDQDTPRTRVSNFDHAETRFGYRSMLETLWNVWRKKKMDEIVSAQLIDRLMREPKQEYWSYESRPEIDDEDTKITSTIISHLIGWLYL